MLRNKKGCTHFQNDRWHQSNTEFPAWSCNYEDSKGKYNKLRCKNRLLPLRFAINGLQPVSRDSHGDTYGVADMHTTR